MRTIGRPRFQITSLYKTAWPDSMPQEYCIHINVVCHAVASRAWRVHRPQTRAGQPVALTLFYKNWPVLGRVPWASLSRRLGAALHGQLRSK